MAAKISVLHLALTPLAGSPVRICRALSEHTQVSARLVVLDPQAYGTRAFDGDLAWNQDRDEAQSLLAAADVLHLHHWMDLRSNPFGIDIEQFRRRGKRVVRQFHTHPRTIAGGDESLAAKVVADPLPQLVLAQFHERFYPRARLVPNLVPLADPRYAPRTDAGLDGKVRIFFAPSVPFPASASRWDTKGCPETLAMLHRLVAENRQIDLCVVHGVPHAECLRLRRQSDVAIDELVTGSFHLSSLEAMAQGVPIFAFLDQRMLHVVAEMTGAAEHPWMNFRLEDAEVPLRRLVGDEGLRQAIGCYGRQWIETYWNDRQMVGHYVRAYEDLLERPHVFDQPRFDPADRRVLWLLRDRDDAVWEARFGRDTCDGRAAGYRDKPRPADVLKRAFWQVAAAVRRRAIRPIVRLCSRAVLGRDLAAWADLPQQVQEQARRIDELQRVLDLAAGNPSIVWLYKNRDERMDATVDLFDPVRRAFHLARYQFAAPHVAGKTVADVACGTGYGTDLLAAEGKAARAIGVDLGAAAIAYARANHMPSGVEFLAASGDATGLPDRSVDVVVSFETIEHVHDDRALLSEFHRILKPGGLLIVSTPNDWPLEASPFHVRSYDRAAFEAALAVQFADVRLFAQNSQHTAMLDSLRPLAGEGPRSVVPGVGEDGPRLPLGIEPLTPANAKSAECLIAVCTACESGRPRRAE